MASPEHTLTLTGDSCACGCQTVACPDCGGIRCLHCDPLCEKELSCHEGDEIREARAAGAR